MNQHQHQQHLAECLIDVNLLEDDARFVQNIINEDRELSEKDDLRIKTLYEENFGYGIEDGNDQRHG